MTSAPPPPYQPIPRKHKPRFDTAIRVLFHAPGGAQPPEVMRRFSQRLISILTNLGFQHTGGNWVGAAWTGKRPNRPCRYAHNFVGGQVGPALQVLEGMEFADRPVEVKVLRDAPRSDIVLAQLQADWAATPGDAGLVAEMLGQLARERDAEADAAGFDCVAAAEAQQAVAAGAEAMIVELLHLTDVQTAQAIVAEAITMRHGRFVVPPDRADLDMPALPTP